MEFGDKFYTGATEPLPDGVFEVAIERPLGIQFEEVGPVIGKSGVSVIAVVDDSNAAKQGDVQVGDKLVGVTAIQFVGAKWERKMFSCAKWGFDTVVDAIGSNEPKFECSDVILQFERADKES
jgi:C-terminal processing protease CtpA/Prc